MRRLLCVLLLAVLTVCLLAGSVSALDEVYFIEELGISVTVPDNHSVATRQVEDDNLILYDFDATAEELRTYMEETDTYLLIHEYIYYGYEIELYSIDSDGWDFRTFTDKELESVEIAMKESFAEDDCTDLTSGIYERDNALYFLFSYSYEYNGEPAYSIKYITARDDRLYMFNLFSYIPPDKEVKYQFKRMIDYLEYGVAAPTNGHASGAAPSPSDETSQYYLEDLGISLSVPANDLVVTRETDANDPVLKGFGMDKEELDAYLQQLYGHMWIWAEDNSYTFLLSVVDEIDLPNMDALSDSELAEMLQMAEESNWESGYTVLENDIYRGENGIFLRLLNADETGTEKYDYITVYNKKVLYFSLYTVDEPVTAAMRDTLSQIVDSVQFGTPDETVPRVSTTKEQTSAPASEADENKSAPPARAETTTPTPEQHTETEPETPQKEPSLWFLRGIALLLGLIAAVAAGVLIGSVAGQRKKQEPHADENTDAPWEM